ncbi:hypothetical protein ACUUL3_06945 [Thiovibrio sp. JS02]
MSSDKTHSAGDEIDSRCLKCKTITNHTIVAMLGGRVAKVECNTCHGRHNYRPPAAEKSGVLRRGGGGKVSGGKGGGRVSPEMKAAAHYEEVLAGRSPEGALPYAMTATFAQGDLIEHPDFGLGLVTKKISASRIEVIFRAGVKVMVCGQGQAGR